MSSHAENHLDIEFQDGDWLVFGKESVGLSQEVLDLFDKENQLKIMSSLIRSFNIANSVVLLLC
jgi:tRNA (cytidine/uridine-2'-O-)-methyltransferase